MMHCIKCGGNLSPGARFCGACGAPIDGRATGTWVPAVKTPVGAAAIAAIQERKRSVGRAVLSGGGLACAGLVGGTLVFGRSSDALGAASIVALIVLFAGTAVYCAVTQWSQQDYYSVPGSRDGTGNHRCLWCGNRGIYKHGEYKTNTKYADCSKCGKRLWTE